MNVTDRVYAVLAEQLASGAWSAGSRLPSLNRLAERYGVSRSTMWKCLTRLKNESVIHTNPRGAIFAGLPGSSVTGSGAGELLWERIKTRAGQDVITGVFGSHELPPVNKLALHYGVSVRTVKKALAGLEKQGVLGSHGRRHVPARSLLHRRSSTFMFVSYGTTGVGILLGDPRIQQVVESFERECARLGYTSMVEGFSEQDPRSFMELSSTIKNMKDISGIVINVWGASNETYLRRWNDLFLFLAGRNIPVVILDQSGTFPVAQTALNSELVRILRISAESAGERVAEVMLRTGHERIAYVTPYFNTHWARARYAGLCRYIKNFGPPAAAVSLYALDETADQSDLNLAIMELGKDAVRRLYADSLSSDEIRGLVDKLDLNHWQELKRKTAFSDHTGTIRAFARFLSDLAKKPHDLQEFSILLNTLHHIASNHAVEDYLKPFLQDIFSKSSATAWVCSDDKTAITVVSYLRSRNKRVPEDVSVMGFDNWRAAYENRLSTFDFNMNGMMVQAMLMLLDKKTFSARPVISEVEGYVVERRTTRR